MISGFAHVAPLELWPFSRYQTINIALLAELGLACSSHREIACAAKYLEFSKCVTNVRVSATKREVSQV